MSRSVTLLSVFFLQAPAIIKVKKATKAVVVNKRLPLTFFGTMCIMILSQGLLINERNTR